MKKKMMKVTLLGLGFLMGSKAYGVDILQVLSDVAVLKSNMKNFKTNVEAQVRVLNAARDSKKAIEAIKLMALIVTPSKSISVLLDNFVEALTTIPVVGEKAQGMRDMTQKIATLGSLMQEAVSITIGSLKAKRAEAQIAAGQLVEPVTVPNISMSSLDGLDF